MAELKDNPAPPVPSSRIGELAEMARKYARTTQPYHHPVNMAGAHLDHEVAFIASLASHPNAAQPAVQARGEAAAQLPDIETEDGRRRPREWDDEFAQGLLQANRNLLGEYMENLPGSRVGPDRMSKKQRRPKNTAQPPRSSLKKYMAWPAGLHGNLPTHTPPSLNGDHQVPLARNSRLWRNISLLPLEDSFRVLVERARATGDIGQWVRVVDHLRATGDEDLALAIEIGLGDDIEQHGQFWEPQEEQTEPGNTAMQASPLNEAVQGADPEWQHPSLLGHYMGVNTLRGYRLQNLQADETDPETRGMSDAAFGPDEDPLAWAALSDWHEERGNQPRADELRRHAPPLRRAQTGKRRRMMARPAQLPTFKNRPVGWSSLFQPDNLTLHSAAQTVLAQLAAQDGSANSVGSRLRTNATDLDAWLDLIEAAEAGGVGRSLERLQQLLDEALSEGQSTEELVRFLNARYLPDKPGYDSGNLRPEIAPEWAAYRGVDRGTAMIRAARLQREQQRAAAAGADISKVAQSALHDPAERPEDFDVLADAYEEQFPDAAEGQKHAARIRRLRPTPTQMARPPLSRLRYAADDMSSDPDLDGLLAADHADPLTRDAYHDLMEERGIDPGFKRGQKYVMREGRPAFPREDYEGLLETLGNAVDTAVGAGAFFDDLESQEEWDAQADRAREAWNESIRALQGGDLGRVHELIEEISGLVDEIIGGDGGQWDAWQEAGHEDVFHVDRQFLRRWREHPERKAARGSPNRYAAGPFDSASPQAMTASSENKDSDLSFDSALQRTQSADQKTFKQSIQQQMEMLGLKAESHNAVGDWEDGAEHSVLSFIPERQSMDQLRYLGAWQGLLGNQRSVLVFNPEPSGLDSVYDMHVPETDLKAVRAQLSKAGIPFRSLVPGKNGARVVVYDEKRQLRDKVAQFAGAYGARIRESLGQGEYVGGGSRSAARSAYRKIIAAHEARSGSSGAGSGAVQAGQAQGDDRGRGTSPKEA